MVGRRGLTIVVAEVRNSMKLSKYLKHVTVAALIAAVLVVFAPTLHADDGFWNCQTIWYYTQCYWVDLGTLTADFDSFGFEAMYRLCQALGLCP